MNTVLIYSGGLDSTTALYWLLDRGDRVRTLSINYGQRHVRELTAAASITLDLGVEHRIVYLTSMRALLRGSSQTDDTVPVPDGHYADESMRLTVVPNRNMLMLACALAWAASSNADSVAYAAHAGDHAVYPDCRPEFVAAMARAAELCHFTPITILAPFINFSKAEIVRIGAGLRVPFEKTWSCYRGEAVHCGTCGTCYERREAFRIADVWDPTHYLKES